MERFTSLPTADAVGNIFIGSTSAVYCLNSIDGSTKWSLPVSAVVTTQPVISRDGNVYVGTSDGKIYALGSLDTDGDGLLDSWETNGMDVDGDGLIDLPLNEEPFNADPLHKDIFVEIDYMEGNYSHNHKPDPTALQAVVSAFATAPIANPDGVNGINLHIFVDESIPEVNSILFDTRGPGVLDDFDDLKNAYFGAPSDRLFPLILEARRQVFRYCIFGHRYKVINSSGIAEDTNSSGIAELPGNDFLVTLRVEPGPNNDFLNASYHLATQWGTSFSQEWSDMQAGTFMHELGHTLGLGHGGADSVNCKPNYLSVMNYTRQFNLGGRAIGIPGIADLTPIRTNRPLDYSREQLLNLDEDNLDEKTGIDGLAGSRTLFGVGIAGGRSVGPSDGAIDWNINGILENAIASDINFVSGLSDPSPSEVLRGHNDWSNIVFNFRNSQNFIDRPTRITVIDKIKAPTTREPELTDADYLDGGLGNVDFDNDGVANTIDNCPLVANPNQEDSDGDGIGDVCSNGTSVDLTLVNRSPQSTASVGSEITYTINLTNDGLVPATNVTVTDDLPLFLTFVSCSSSGSGICQGSGNSRIITFPSLAPGQIETITLIATIDCTVSDGAEIINTAIINSDMLDYAPNNNSMAVTIAASNERSISPTNQLFSSRGGSGRITVTTTNGCPWTASSNVSWIQLIGIDSGSVTFVVRGNLTQSPRQGTLNIAGLTFTAVQVANCNLSISPTQMSFAAIGGNGTITITTSGDCGWFALSNVSWITIISGNNGIGNGSVTYSVDPNTGAGRGGTITISGRNFTIKQKRGQ